MNASAEYLNLIRKDGTHEKDTPRRAMFYIIANNPDLYKKVNHIYDFSDHSIKIECLEEYTVDFSSGSRSLVKIAFNLFNGYPADIRDTLSALDKNNYDLAIQAIAIRFNK